MTKWLQMLFLAFAKWPRKVENPSVPQCQTSALKARGVSNLLESHLKGKAKPSNPKRSPQEMNLGLDALFTYWFIYFLFFFFPWIEELSNPRGACRVWIALVWQKSHALNNDLMLDAKPAQRAEFFLQPSGWVRGSKARRLCAMPLQAECRGVQEQQGSPCTALQLPLELPSPPGCTQTQGHNRETALPSISGQHTQKNTT